MRASERGRRVNGVYGEKSLSSILEYPELLFGLDTGTASSCIVDLGI